MQKFILALAATALFAAPAVAGEGHSWKVGNDSYRIYSSDLDMNTVAGRATLLARVERAATKLCETRIGSERKACVDQSVQQVGGTFSGQIRLAQAERHLAEMASR